MPRSALRALLGLALVAALGVPAAAEGVPSAWLKLDRITAEPSPLAGLARVRVYVSAVRLEGDIIPVSGKDAWTLQVGASRKRLPYVAGTFGGSGQDLAIALVIQTSAEFADALPIMHETLGGFLDELPSGVQVTVVAAGETVHGGTRLGDLARARSELGKLEAESFPEEPQLIKAVDRAVTTLERAKTAAGGKELRRMVIVVGDGRDDDFDPDRYRKIAERADGKNIRIHTVAFSPIDSRSAMVGLGELSKRSHGTLRWVRTKTVPDLEGVEVLDTDDQTQAFQTQLRTLGQEVTGQYVLTWFLPPEQIANKSVSVAWNDLRSNEVRAGNLACGGETCEGDAWCYRSTCVTRGQDEGRGILGWLLMIGAIAVGGLFVLVGIGFVLSRMSEKRAAGTALAQASAEVEAQRQPQVPDHRIVPQGPQGGRVGPPAGAAPGAHPAPGGAPPIAPIGPGGGPVQPVHPGGAAPVAPAAQPSLMVLSGPLQGRRLPLRHGFTIGKAPNCDLVLAQDGFASSHHAQILMDTAGGCTLVDKNSTNGTFVNGVRTQQMRLTHGMSIRVGGSDMRFLEQ